MFPTVTVVCPIYNEIKYIDAFVSAILSQDYPQEKMSALLVDGMSTDGTRERLREITASHGNIRVVDNPKRIAPCAMNIGIRMATSDVIVRLDAHCTYPTNYVSTLVSELLRLEADNVGGVWNILPAKDTAMCKAIAIASGHPFGAGTALYRTGVDKVTQVDTVPFGCFRRSLFDKIGLFDEELARAEDCEINARIRRNGGEVYIIPSVKVKYYARDTFLKNCMMFYQYGLFKPLVNKKLGRLVNVRQLAPLALVLWLSVGLVASLCFPSVAAVYTTGFAVYLLACLFVAIACAVKEKQASLVLTLMAVIPSIHICYGVGIGVGGFNVMHGRVSNVDPTR